MEKQKLLAKLPDRFTSQCNREAARERKEQKRYPAFKNFTAFINAEADLASNPISSCNAVACVAGVNLIPFPFPFERLPRRLVTQRKK